jgi:DNA-binding CsgD family transcriptional regulator
MPKPAQLRVQDIRRIAALVGECRELGDDPTVWRTHLIAELGRLTGAGFGLGGEIAGCARGPRRDLGIIDWGWENGFDRAAWIEMLTIFGHDPFYNPVINAYVDRLSPDGGLCLGRTDMIPDRDWYQSDYFQTLHRPVGTDATLLCFRPIPDTTDQFNEVFLARPLGERDFSARDRAIVLEVCMEIAPHVGRSLARFADPAPAALAPRERLVLKCLLEGDGDKQIAARLGISRFTVNGHTKAVFKHFGVAGRAELLARWIRRGWGSKFAWAEEE